MNGPLALPPVLTLESDVGRGVLAVSGLRLESLLALDLLRGRCGAPEELVALREWLDEGWRGLARATATWPSDVALELHLLGRPNLSNVARGSVQVSLLLWTRASDAEEAHVELLRRFQALRGVLASRIAAADFTPLESTDELRARLRPMEPTHAVRLTRRRARLRLGDPLPGQARPLGFGSGAPATPVRREADQREVDHVFPWAPGADDGHALIRRLLWHPADLWIIVRLRPVMSTAAERGRLAQSMARAEEQLRQGERGSPVLARQAAAVRDACFERLAVLDGGALDVGVHLVSGAPVDVDLVQTLGSWISAAPSPQSSSELLRGGFSARRLRDPSLALRPFGPPDPDGPCTVHEATAAFRLPLPPGGPLPGLPIRRNRSAPALLPERLLQTARTVRLGINRHRGVAQPVPLSVDDRMRHTLVLGATGTGKSTLLKSLLLQDLRAGRGLCLLDPHGELVDSLLATFPPERRQDLTVLDLADRDWPVPLNLLAWRELDERDQIIDELYGTVGELYDLRTVGGPMFEHYFRGLLRLLMGAKHHEDFVATMLEFPLVFQDDKLRKALLSRCSERQMADFVKEIESTTGETSLKNMAPYITSKLGRFMHDRTLRRIFGQQEMALDFRSVMDEGRVVLVNLAKGRLGSTVSALVARQLVARFKAAALGRADQPPERRRDFFVYVDEFQNLNLEAFGELLAEARKYRLGLVLANQFLDQLEHDHRRSGMIASVLGNVGTTVAFRLGTRDAERLAPVFRPSFDLQDLLELPNWQAYVRLHSDAGVLHPFSIHTVPDGARPDPELAEELRAESRRRWARPAAEVDRSIELRREALGRFRER